MPEELREQVPVMKEVLGAMGIQTVEQPGLEADDILGTLAKRAEKDGLEVSLISGDRDLLQIASSHIKIRIPKTKGGRTEIEDYYAADVEAKYQVNPVQFIDLKALMGDTADNIPGVPKVGEKTATELMVKFGSLEEIYNHIDEVSKKSIRESLAANRELADLSKVLATIKVDGDVVFDYEDAKIRDFYTDDAYKIFMRLGFKNMLSRFEKSGEENKQADYFKEVTDFGEAEKIFQRLKGLKGEERASFEIIEDSCKEEDFVGLALAFGETEVYFLKPEGFLKKDYLLGMLSEAAGDVRLVTFDIKKKYRYLKTDRTGRLFDILIAAYLLNPLKNDYGPEDIASEYLGMTIPGRVQLFGKTPLKAAAEEKGRTMAEYACFLAYVEWMAEPILKGKLAQMGMERLMNEIEMPLSYVLYDMEKEGILVKPDELKAYGEALNGRIEELETSIHQKAGCDFNINSPKQLGEILFGQMQIPGGKKTKTGYSTAADVLEKLAPDYPIVEEILEYRGLAKLKSTYAEGLAAFIGQDDRTERM